MAFSRPSLSEIYGRIKADMESRIANGSKVPRFSLAGILCAVFAGAVWSLYGYLVWLGRQFFPESADDEYVDAHAARFGIMRKAAAYAEGIIRFDGTVGVVILAGREVQTTGGLIFTTDADATIGMWGSIVAAVTCSESGIVGNTRDLYLYLVAPLTGVATEAPITTAPAGGTDLESTEELRARVIQRTANPPSSGTASDYVRWALEVSGVGRAWCLPAELYKGAGTVGVVISTTELTPVSAQIHSDAVDYLEGVRPLGAVLTVEDVMPAQVYYSISISPNTVAIQNAVTEALQELHRSEATPGGTIYLSHISAAIMSSGVENAEVMNIVVDSVSLGPIDIEVTGYIVATFHGATYNTLT